MILFEFLVLLWSICNFKNHKYIEYCIVDRKNPYRTSHIH